MESVFKNKYKERSFGYFLNKFLDEELLNLDDFGVAQSLVIFHFEV